MWVVDQIICLSSAKRNLIALLSQEEICEIIIDEALIENIYYGIVREQARAEKAFFVEYEKGKTGYLKSNLNLALGSKVLVMVKKTGGGKIPELTSNLSFVGNFIIYQPLSKQPKIAVSHKLNQTARDQFKQYFLDKITDNESIIIRSSAQNTKLEKLFEELILLKNQAREIMNTTHKPLVCLYRKTNFLEELIAGHAFNLSRIITNKTTVFNKLKLFCKDNLPQLTDKIIHLKTKSILEEYDFETLLESIVGPKVKIKPYGELAIIPTPALTAIDVDSEAAQNNESFVNSWVKAIVLQIKLRNLSGKIVIDPPFLPNFQKLKIIVSQLALLLKDDSVKSLVAGVSPLGNIEISRERIRPPLLEILGGYDKLYNQELINSNLSNLINELKQDC